MSILMPTEQNNFDSDSDDDYFQEENCNNLNNTNENEHQQPNQLYHNLKPEHRLEDKLNGKVLNIIKNPISISSAESSPTKSDNLTSPSTSNHSVITLSIYPEKNNKNSQKMDPVAHQRLHSSGNNDNSNDVTSSAVPFSEPNTSTSSISQLSPMSTLNEERMRRKLQFFFMNPIEKWKARRKFPYKFVVQLIKLVIVTMQLCLFAHSRYNHVNYTWDNRVTFSHLFLRGWDDASEVDSYPPAKGPLALYMADDFYATIDFALKGYGNLTGTIGSYSYPTENNEMAPIQLCLYHYKECTVFGFNESYIFNPDIVVVCTNLTRNVSHNGSQQYLQEKGIKVDFAALVKATLDFSVKTVNFKVAGPIAPPDCYQFDVQIFFDNRDHDGQMMLSLDAEPIRLHCKGNTEYVVDSEIDELLRSLLNFFVIIICAISFALCTRAVYRANLLRKQTDALFRITYGRPLDDKWAFLNLWYVMIIFNDVFLIIGSIIKESIERKNFAADQWNVCSVLLGVGNLSVWFGVLRYFSFFKTYNVVILTLKSATPKISRFLLCALLIYAGFTFCGWLVLGPYNIKFRSLATTSECLFSLINGDDMFATFAITLSKSPMLWWFSRIYLYSFISLFIYVVLSLFIAVIMDAYDTIKKYYKDGFPQSDLKQFIGQMHPSDFSSGVFLANDDTDNESLFDMVKSLCCACIGIKRQENPGPTGYESLVQK